MLQGLYLTFSDNVEPTGSIAFPEDELARCEAALYGKISQLSELTVTQSGENKRLFYDLSFASILQINIPFRNRLSG